jgi:hypothetical protein
MTTIDHALADDATQETDPARRTGKLLSEAEG